MCSTHIPQLFHIYLDKQSLYLQMEKAGKYNLRQYLRLNGKYLSVVLESPFNSQPQSKEKLFLKIVRAVNHLHSNKVVHGDIKQSNIMVGTHGEIKLIDFGLSSIIGRNNKILYKFRGSPYYMAPEILSEIPYDGRSH